MAFGLLGGMNSVSATKTNWSPNSTWEGYAGCKWTEATNTFSWNGTRDVRAIETGFQNRDLTGYTKFHATVSKLTGDGVNKVQLKVNCTGGEEKLIDLSNGENLIDMTTWFADASAVTTFELWGPTSSDTDCSAVVTDVYLEKPDAPFSVTTASGFGDEITELSYITGGNKFVISNGTNALYFEGDQDAKDAAVQSVPSTSYYYYTLTEISLDLNSDETPETYYAINIVNEAGTAFPAPYSLGNCLNFTGNTADEGNALFSGSCQSDRAQGYGTDCQYKGLWEITYSSENGGFALRNVCANKYAIVRGNSADPIYLKLYKSIEFTNTTTYPANDEIFALTNAAGYNAETGEMTNGTWTFGTPVDISNWDYLMITTVNNPSAGSHEITITDDDGLSVGGEGYSGPAAGTGGNMWLDRWNNQNAIRISIDYLKNTKSMDVTKIKSLSISGKTKIANVYLTSYNNTKISGGYKDGDVKREYSATGKFGTICLPYKASYSGAEVYSIASKDESAITLTKVNGLLEAGKPYFYMSADENGQNNEGTVRNVNFFRADFDEYDAANPITNNGLIGTFSGILAAPQGANYYVLSNNKLYNVDSEVTVGANKAYINKSAIVNIPVSAHVLEIDFNEPTGIETVANSQEMNANSKFFNLAGQRVAQPTKGLYIVNGKKVLVK